jgi:cytochrome c peroxidase
MYKTSISTRVSLVFRSAILSTLVAVGVTGMSHASAQAKDEPIQPIVPAKITNPTKVELGAKLFFDPRLSKSGFISCNSCHNLSMGGSDNLPTSIGDRWQQGPINSPTVLNSSLNHVQFWDGRAKDLQDQAGGPIANPKEMGFTHELAIEVLNSIPQYREEFAKVYGNNKLDIQQVTDAIAEFEKTLKTPNSRFDKWLKGDSKAITAEELKGYQLFKNSGCVACHNGEAVGGNSFQKMGVFEPYKTSSPEIGRAEVTKADADRFFFKVPTLRNVELTYPYFHDGAARTLEEAVDLMGRLQLARKYTPEEVAQIVAVLKTLTGEQPKLQLPILPPSQNKTPRPKPFN